MKLYLGTNLYLSYIWHCILLVELGGDGHSHTLLVAVQNDTTPYGGAFGNVSRNHKRIYPWHGNPSCRKIDDSYACVSTKWGFVLTG